MDYLFIIVSTVYIASAILTVIYEFRGRQWRSENPIEDSVFI